MRWWSILIVVAAGFALVACASNPAGPGPRSAGSGQPGDSSALTGASTDNGAAPAPPDWANFTLLCHIFDGPDHVMESTQLKQELIQYTKDNNWYVVHREDESDLCYGYYKTFDDRSQVDEFTRSQNDRNQVRAMRDRVGNPLFAQVVFVPVNSPDPPAPADWDVFQNPGFWTLQIAKYLDSPLRKQTAVDAVRQLRAAGYPAYFHHFTNVSEVYIGAWPRSAVKEQQSSVAESNDTNASLLVLTQAVAGMDTADLHDKNGHKVTVIEPKLEVQDPTLRSAIDHFKYTEINGAVVGSQRDAEGKIIPYPCYLVQVPHTHDSPASPASPSAPAPTPGPGDSANPLPPSIPGLDVPPP